ncbi:MAG: hypothetical protein WDZ40_01230 [Candidatus Spechtbacterales bacterium]
MNTVFYVLVAVLLVGAGAYWWFFMKGQGGKKKVDMAEGGPAQSQESTDMSGGETPTVESIENTGSGQDQNPAA